MPQITVIFTDAEKRAIRKMRADGKSLDEIAKTIGKCGRTVIARHLSEEGGAPTQGCVAERKVTREDAFARMREIPEDTRDLTALLMGDPLPGRRAIDMRGGA